MLGDPHNKIHEGSSRADKEFFFMLTNYKRPARFFFGELNRHAQGFCPPDFCISLSAAQLSFAQSRPQTINKAEEKLLASKKAANKISDDRNREKLLLPRSGFCLLRNYSIKSKDNPNSYSTDQSNSREPKTENKTHTQENQQPR